MINARRFRLSTIAAAIRDSRGPLQVRFARTRRELDAALRLRFEVFNLELGEGLASSYETGRDTDEFDETCHHLMVLDALRMKSSALIECRRAKWRCRKRFLLEGEYDLRSFSPEVLRDSVELGRACIARAHRNAQVLFLLWKGLAAYCRTTKAYLFGCCSLTSQDASEGFAYGTLEESNQLRTTRGRCREKASSALPGAG